MSDNHDTQVVQALSNLEVAANTVAYCYFKRPANFAVALRDLEFRAEEARELLKDHRDATDSL